jgi:hypothetical protein
MILTHGKEKKEVFLIHPRRCLNAFGGMGQILFAIIQKSFRILLPG